MITGFFYTQTLKSGRVVKQIKKILIYVLVANCLHICWAIFKLIIGKESVVKYFKSVVDFQSLLNLFCFNQPVWRISLWYINALFYVLILIYLFQKLKKADLSKLYPLIPLLLTGNLILSTYSTALFDIELPLCYSRNFLLCGLPYFLLGDFIYRYRDKFKMSKIFVGFGVLLFFITSFVELFVLKYYNLIVHKDCLISTVFLAFFVFIFFLKAENDFGSKAGYIAEFGKRYSFIIYISHSIIIEIFSKVINKISAFSPFVKDVFIAVGPILILTIATCVSIIFSCFKSQISDLIKSN